jgi:hypothetical protein
MNTNLKYTLLFALLALCACGQDDSDDNSNTGGTGTGTGTVVALGLAVLSEEDRACVTPALADGSCTDADLDADSCTFKFLCGDITLAIVTRNDIVESGTATGCEPVDEPVDDETFDAPFACGDGSTIESSTWVCDGDADCADGADEADPADCEMLWFCDSGEYSVTRSWLCDGEDDCPDGSDEGQEACGV